MPLWAPENIKNRDFLGLYSIVWKGHKIKSKQVNGDYYKGTLWGG